MARQVNTPFLEEWLRAQSGSSVDTTEVRPSASSARAIIQAWADVRDASENQCFGTRHLQSLKTLLGSRTTLHVADPQAKLIISILSSQSLNLPSDSYPLCLRLLYIWIRKSYRPSSVLVGSAVEVLSHVFGANPGKSGSFLAEGVVLLGALTCAPCLFHDSKLVCVESLCGLLEGDSQLAGSQGKLVPEVLAGIGYALSSNMNAHYVRLLDFLFRIWEKEWLSLGDITHGLMILHLVEWMMSGFIKAGSQDKISVFAKEVLETPKANYAIFAVLMAAAGVLRGSSRNTSGGRFADTILRPLRAAAESRIGSLAQALTSEHQEYVKSRVEPSDTLLLQCFSLALARCGPVSSSTPLLLCLASALLNEVFPLGHIYRMVLEPSHNVSGGRRLEYVNKHLVSVLFKEAGAITGAFCNQYVVAIEEKKRVVENLLWDFCLDIYSRHRQLASLLRGTEDQFLQSIEKIAESCFLMIVVFSLAVTKQLQNSELYKEKRMETSVQILVSFSCVEYFRRVRLPEYIDTIRGVIVGVQENESACISFISSMPSYQEITTSHGVISCLGDSFTKRKEYVWAKDDVQTARILFYLRVMPTCIARLPASLFRRVVAPTMFLYMGHPNQKAAQASHAVFVAFVSSGKDSEEDERVQLKEQLVFYYMERCLEGYPGITPFEGMASAVAALVQHLPAGSPAIFYTVNSLIDKASSLYNEVLAHTKGDWKHWKTQAEPFTKILELLLRLISLVDVQVLPSLMKSLAQLIIRLPRDGQNQVLDELYGQIAESDDVVRKPTLVSWLQSLNYLCSQSPSEGYNSKAKAKQGTSAFRDCCDRLESRL